MSTAPLPERVEHIDAGWLTAALRDGGRNPGAPGVTVTTIEVEPLGAGTAFLGSLARLRAIHDAPGVLPDAFVVKLPSPDEGAQRVGRMLDVWNRESHFYARLAEQLPDDVAVPTCRYNQIDDAGRAVLVLDDLAPAAPGDQVEGADDDQARAAVTQLARCQSPWWGRPRTQDLEWVPGIDRADAGVGLQHAVTAGLDRFEARFADRLPVRSVTWNRRFAPRLAAWLQALATRPLTIAHADFRLENLLFHPSGGVTVIDWQTAMYTGGVTDLTFLCCTSLTTESRRRLEGELVDRYLDELRRRGVPADQLAHVRFDYVASMLWWMAMLGNNLASIDAPDERSRALFDAMLTRLHAAAVDHDAGRHLPA